MVRIALVGAGAWGRNLVRNFHALGSLASVCETDGTTMESLRSDYPDVAVGDDYATVLEDESIQAVAISTPAATHGEYTRMALEAGKDVFVEKPLCLSEKQGLELCALAEERGRILMVGHLLWYHPAVLKLKELVDAGELGRIRYIYSNRLNIGKLRREENVLWSFAPHDISVITGLIDEMPTQVRAQGGNFLHEKIPDTTVSLLNYDSGIRAHIFVSWLHPFKEQKLIVVGDRKMAVFDDVMPWGEKLVMYPHRIDWNHNIPRASKAQAEKVELEESEPLQNECRHFIECVSGRAGPRTGGREGLKVLEILNACQVSLEETQPASISREAQPADYFVHPTSEVERSASVGAGTKIWHFSHVLDGVRIGRGCNLGQNVVVGPNASVGDGCKIQNNVSVYEGVVLEDYVFCGPSMVFTNVRVPRAHIRRMEQHQETRVGKGATIGANATIVCGATLGKYCFIGAASLVTKDVPDHALVYGQPARQHGWVCECGYQLKDYACQCGKRYQETESGLVEVSEP